MCKSHLFSEVIILSRQHYYSTSWDNQCQRCSHSKPCSHVDSDITIFSSTVSWVLLRLRFNHLSLHPGQLLRLGTLYLATYGKPTRGGGGRSMEVFVRKDCFMKLNMARDEDFGGGRIKPEVGTLSLGVT